MSTSKAIAKNTLFLYIRMFLTMAVSLYTSRVVLNVLGVEDFGIYGAVAGFVSLFGFLNAAMSTATQRYLAVDTGRKDWVKLKETFNSTLVIHCFIAVAIIIFCETIGLWFLNNRLNIPEDRLNAANMVYHVSVLSSAVSITQVPFNALIIVRDRIKDFATFSIVEVILKLAIVYLLGISNSDKLVLYSVLLLSVTLIISTYYKVYCLRHFEESRFKWYFNKGYYKNLLQYSGWNLFGSLSAVAKGQGINILINLFFGTVLNASYAVMLQVQNAVNVFNSNFLMVIRPQIIKKYAGGQFEEYQRLTMQGSKFSFLLMHILIVPIVFNIDFILKLWLKNPPDFANIFIVLSLVNLLIDSFSGTLMTAVQATGKIKWYQIILGLFLFFNLPISYLVYSLYKMPELSFYVGIVLSIFSLAFRLTFLKYLINFQVEYYLMKVILPSLLIVCFTGILYHINPFGICNAINLSQFILNSVLITLINIIALLFVGLTRKERGVLFRGIEKWLNRLPIKK